MGRVPLLLSLGGVASGSTGVDSDLLAGVKATTQASPTVLNTDAATTWVTARTDPSSSSTSPAESVSEGRTKSDFFELHNTYTGFDLHGHSAQDYQDQDWASYSDKDCRWSLLTPHRADQNALLCRAKCEGQYSPGSCSGYLNDGAMPSAVTGPSRLENALCADSVDDVKAACQDDELCWGVQHDQSPDGSIFYLLSYSCSQESYRVDADGDGVSTSDLYYKVPGDIRACELGVAFQVTGVSGEQTGYPDFDGIYERRLDSCRNQDPNYINDMYPHDASCTHFRNYDQPDLYLAWLGANWNWVLAKDHDIYANITPDADPTCTYGQGEDGVEVDNDDLLGQLIYDLGDFHDTSIGCADAFDHYYQIMSTEVVKSVCPVTTSSGCREDNDVAVFELSSYEILGGATTCAEVAVNSVLAHQLCPSLSLDRRLAVPAEPLPVAFFEQARAAARRMNTDHQTGQDSFHLNPEVYYHLDLEIFYSSQTQECTPSTNCEPVVPLCAFKDGVSQTSDGSTAPECIDYDPDAADMSTPDMTLDGEIPLYDYKSFVTDSITMSTSLFCDNTHQDQWIYEFSVTCPESQLATAYSQIVPIVDQLCYRRCSTAYGGDADADYCEGADGLTLDSSSNAICAPQEVCQELCDLHANCTGIEMHNSLPLCYLVEGECDGYDEDSVAYKSSSDDFSIIHNVDKGSFPFDPATGYDAVTFETFSAASFGGSSLVFLSQYVDNDVCSTTTIENNCNSDDNCIWFADDATPCKLLASTGTRPASSASEAAVSPVDEYEVHSSTLCRISDTVVATDLEIKDSTDANYGETLERFGVTTAADGGYFGYLTYEMAKEACSDYDNCCGFVSRGDPATFPVVNIEFLTCDSNCFTGTTDGLGTDIDTTTILGETWDADAQETACAAADQTTCEAAELCVYDSSDSSCGLIAEYTNQDVWIRRRGEPCHATVESDAFPEANGEYDFVGATGTPLSLTDANTWPLFQKRGDPSYELVYQAAPTESFPVVTESGTFGDALERKDTWSLRYGERAANAAETFALCGDDNLAAYYLLQAEDATDAFTSGTFWGDVSVNETVVDDTCNSNAHRCAYTYDSSDEDASYFNVVFNGLCSATCALVHGYTQDVTDVTTGEVHTVLDSDYAQSWMRELSDVSTFCTERNFDDVGETNYLTDGCASCVNNNDYAMQAFIRLTSLSGTASVTYPSVLDDVANTGAYFCDDDTVHANNGVTAQNFDTNLGLPYGAEDADQISLWHLTEPVFSTVLRSLCPSTQVDAFYYEEEVVTTVIPDEDTVEGSEYRRLAGSDVNIVTGFADVTTWTYLAKDHLTTGSDCFTAADATSTDCAPTVGDVSHFITTYGENQGMVSFDYRSTAQSDMLSALALYHFNGPSDTWYPWAQPQSQGTFELVCKGIPAVATRTTAIVDHRRFEKEMETFNSADIEEALTLAEGEICPSSSGSVSVTPRVVASSDYVHGSFTANLFEYTPVLQRSWIDTAQYTITGMESPCTDDEHAYWSITVADAHADAGAVASNLLGRNYHHATMPYFHEWTGDVLRVEHKNSYGHLMSGHLHITISNSGLTDDARLFKVKSSAVADGVLSASDFEIVDDGSFYCSGGVCTLSLTGDDTNGDYLFANDLNECTAGTSHCDENAVCHNTVGTAPTCTCESPYIDIEGEQEAGTACIWRADADVALQDFQRYTLRISPQDHLRTGWRVQEVGVYRGPGCTEGKHEAFESGFEANDAYPGSSVHNVLDDNIDTEYQTRLLQLQPDSAHLTIGIDKESVSCIQIQQNPYHASRDLLVERISRDGLVIQSWSHTVPEKQDFDGFVQLELTCGVADQKILAEMLTERLVSDVISPSTTYTTYPASAELNPSVDRETGNYSTTAIPMDSPCACQAACMTTRICHAWNYISLAGVQDASCFLLTAPFEDGQGYYGTQTVEKPYWISGTMPLTIDEYSVEGDASVGPLQVAFDKEFDLKLSGRSLPMEGKKLQRVKIVAAGDGPDAAVPAAVTGVGCVTTGGNSICKSPPKAASGTEITFGPFSIAASGAQASYDVWYCQMQCSRARNWRLLDGSIQAGGDSQPLFTWYAYAGSEIDDGQAVTSLPRDTTAVTFKLERPPFSGFAPSVNPANGLDNDSRDHATPVSWQMRIVPAQYDCAQIVQRSDLFSCGNPSGEQCDLTNDAAAVSYHFPDGFEAVYDIGAGVGLGLANVGAYRVCFRESASDDWMSIPSGTEDNALFLSITRLPADNELPVGFFSSQLFSALAGKENTINVKGSRVEGLFDARVTLNADGVCGDAGNHVFGGFSHESRSPILESVSGPMNAQCVDNRDYSPIRAGCFIARGTTTVALHFDRPIKLGTGQVRIFGALEAENAGNNNYNGGVTYNSDGYIRVNDHSNIPGGYGNTCTTEVPCYDTADGKTIGEDGAWYDADRDVTHVVAQAVDQTLFLDFGAIFNLLEYNDDDSTAADHRPLTIRFDDTFVTGLDGELVTLPEDLPAYRNDEYIGIPVQYYYDASDSASSSSVPSTFNNIQPVYLGYHVDGSVAENSVAFSLAISDDIFQYSSGYLWLWYCGADNTCGTDDDRQLPLNTPNLWTVNPTGSIYKATATLPTYLGDGVYKLQLCDYFERSDDSGERTDGCQDFVFDTYGETENHFHYHRDTVPVASATDDAADFTFGLDLDALTNARYGDNTVYDFAVCLCDPRGLARDLHFGTTDHEIYSQSLAQRHASSFLPAAEDLPTVSFTPCSDCRYGSFTDACQFWEDGLDANTICATDAQCKEVCDASDTCTGFSTDSNGHCLLSSDSTTVEDPAWSTFTPVSGHSCTRASDYTVSAGTLTMTERVSSTADFVFEPNVNASVEVLGRDLTEMYEGEDFGLSYDRIMITACEGVCGISAPTTHVPGGSFEMWNELRAVSAMDPRADLDYHKAEPTRVSSNPVVVEPWKPNFDFDPTLNFDFSHLYNHGNDVINENGDSSGEFTDSGSGNVDMEIVSAVDIGDTIILDENIPNNSPANDVIPDEQATPANDVSADVETPSVDDIVIDDYGGAAIDGIISEAITTPIIDVVGDSVGGDEDTFAFRRRRLQLATASATLPTTGVHSYVSRDDPAQECQDSLDSELWDLDAVLRLNDGVAPLRSWQCYDKCSKGSDDAACNGYFNSVDRPDHRVFCVDVTTAELLCDAINAAYAEGAMARGCGSIRMHQTQPRASFFSHDCLDNLISSPSYYHITRQLIHDDTATYAPLNVPAIAGGFSQAEKLLFAGFSFAQAGNFKICFCDSARSKCDELDDYRIDIGTVRVSGLSCLLTDTSLRSAQCQHQFYGGLRCYHGDVPTEPVVPEIDGAYTQTFFEKIFEYNSATNALNEDIYNYWASYYNM